MTPSRSFSLFVFLLALLPGAADAQLGQLLSPGPLTRAHAKLEGAANCVRCHEQGKRVSAARCLACHQPIARRIAAKKGMHRNVGEECVACHVEHAGRDAELRPFDPKKFDHRAETGFALEGRHAIACARCHTTRSYLALNASCTSCHKDPHGGRLGGDCSRCHPPTAPFQQAAQQFDHSATAFPLEGAHRAVACAKCHEGGKYRGTAHASCADCHRNPHRSKVGADCRSCHTATAWKVAKFDHARTGTPLGGRHKTVACAACHVRPPTVAPLSLRPCAACHKDPHRGTFKDDCAACHDETAFKGTARFDHMAKTRFPLEGKHRALACNACHKKGGDFRGLNLQCASCHEDPHKAQFGPACEKCHSSESFRITRYDHPRFPEFFRGQHAALRCEQCHRGPLSTRSYRGLSTDCASCHRDVHAGEFPQCTRCHTVDAPKFAPVLFDHTATKFPLTGRHKEVACRACHQTGYSGTKLSCASCHKDPHAGRLGPSCEGCHSTASFGVGKYVHRKAGAFFRGKHATATCTGCHPASRPIAERFTGLASCAACHEDPHRGQLGTSCETCHTVEASWKIGAARGFHKAGRFPLEGRHLVTPCEDCHQNGVVSGTPTRCYDCHWVRRQDDRYRTRLGNECEQCHRPTSWSSVNWDHLTRTTFALSGAHRTLSCDQCHRGEFGVARSDCASCHAADFDAASEPNHRSAGYPLVCQICHKPGDASWAQGRFTHSAYALAGVHQTQTCSTCHSSGVYAGTARDCAGCHRADYDQARDPAHAAAGFGTACEQCHRVTDGRWSDATYAHTVWPLIGRHTTPVCSACHAAGSYAGRSRECVACHRADYDQSASPSHVQTGFPVTCELCHALADGAWNLGRFDHTIFPLAGAHTTASCASCHRNGVYSGTSRNCAGCHQSEFNDAQDPNHVAAGFPTTCETCHLFADANWNQGKFSHTTFPLAGAHVNAECSTCHRNGVYAGTARNCAGCHQSEFNDARDPNHIAAGFPTTCETCHKFADANWNQGAFSHTTFPLAGAHLSAECSTCHRNGVYAGTARTCAGCHQSDFNDARDPNHVAAGFQTTCETCHKFADANWDQGTFNHSSFALAGAHVTAECGSCHRNNVYAGTTRSCAGCHQSEFNDARDPNHVAAGFPTTCETCHQFADANWNQGKFSHTTFPLAGAHVNAECSTCHRNGVYAGTARTCAGCHQSDFNDARDPNHLAAGFPTTCETCHKFADANWDQGTFNHSSFALAGAHVTAECGSCHRNNVYAGTTRSCAGCHQSDYNDATDPNHATAGFPTTCETCHRFSDTTWDQGVFTHAIFTLAGAHTAQPCNECHLNGIYLGTPRTCSGCHLSAYNGATDPNHISAGFPVTCETCHRFSDTTWDQGIFTHLVFPLAGVHVTQACTQCHTSGVYLGTPRTCAGCHQSAFNGAQDPNHISAAFPTTCETCHQFSDASWNQGIFAHQTFPLAGVHLTSGCSSCHGGGIYAGTPRACSGCHLTDYNNATTPNHITVGFPTTCESCHRFSDTAWDQGVFVHGTFPLAGVHTTRACSDCHLNGVYAGTPRTCAGCHLTAYNAARDPNHVAAGFPTTCEVCHRFTDNSWNQGTLNHTWFPIATGRHSGLACSECHTTPSVFTVFSCTANCHDRAETDEHHKEEPGYRYDSLACYACHPQGRAD